MALRAESQVAMFAWLKSQTSSIARPDGPIFKNVLDLNTKVEMQDQYNVQCVLFIVVN